MTRFDSSLERVPFDLVAVVALVAVVDVAVVLELAGGARVVLGLLAALFAPGYVLLAVLFPGAGPAREESAKLRGRLAAPSAGPGVTWGERLALSVGASLALLPLLGVGLALAGDALDEGALAGAVTGFVLVGAVFGTVRRLQLPESERLRLPMPGDDARLSDGLAADSRLDAAANLVLALAVLVAVSAVVYGVAAPPSGEQFTSFALLADDGSGELVAGDYPRELTLGEEHELVAAVTNGEGRPTEYTVVVELQRVRTAGDAMAVVDQREVARLRRSLADGETWHARPTIAPRTTGEELRLAFYLYRGDAPADADRASAYRRLHLWVDVAPPRAAGNASAAGAGSNATTATTTTDEP